MAVVLFSENQIAGAKKLLVVLRGGKTKYSELMHSIKMALQSTEAFDITCPPDHTYRELCGRIRHACESIDAADISIDTSSAGGSDPHAKMVNILTEKGVDVRVDCNKSRKPCESCKLAISSVLVIEKTRIDLRCTLEKIIDTIKSIDCLFDQLATMLVVSTCAASDNLDSAQAVLRQRQQSLTPISYEDAVIRASMFCNLERLAELSWQTKNSDQCKTLCDPECDLGNSERDQKSSSASHKVRIYRPCPLHTNTCVSQLVSPNTRFI